MYYYPTPGMILHIEVGEILINLPISYPSIHSLYRGQNFPWKLSFKNLRKMPKYRKIEWYAYVHSNYTQIQLSWTCDIIRDRGLQIVHIFKQNSLIVLYVS